MKLPSFIAGIFAPGDNSFYKTGATNKTASNSSQGVKTNASHKYLPSNPSQEKSSFLSKGFNSVIDMGLKGINALVDIPFDLAISAKIGLNIAASAIKAALNCFSTPKSNSGFDPDGDSQL